MQCPDCGKETEELIHGSCAECASGRVEALKAPQTLAIIVCARCGRIEQGSQWVDPSGDSEDVVLDRMRQAATIHPEVDGAQLAFETQVHDARHTRVTTRLQGTFHGAPVEASAQTLVRVRNGVCEDCSRMAGGYFEAVLQVRGDPQRPIEDAEAVEAAVISQMKRLGSEQREGAFLSKIERVKGGLDFYVGSTEVARVMVRELVERWGAAHSESAKLVGRSKDGRDTYRVTMLVRLPAYAVGDFIRLDGGVYKILDVAKRTVRVLDLSDWSVTRKDSKRAKEILVLGRAQEERDAVVVSQQGRRVQVLDPVSYKTVDVDLPRDAALGDEARVFRHDERVWIVPDLAYAKQ